MTRRLAQELFDTLNQQGGAMWAWHQKAPDCCSGNSSLCCCGKCQLSMPVRVCQLTEFKGTVGVEVRAWPQKLDNKQRCIMEQFSKPVEGDHDGQETASAHDRLTASDQRWQQLSGCT